MRKIILLILLVLIFCWSGFLYAQGSDNKLYFKQTGFSISPLEGKIGHVTSQPLIMMLPPTDGFAPNVNVQVQPYNGTISEYWELSKPQFEQMNWKVVYMKQTEPNKMVFEYEGGYQGKKMHWYAVAVQVENVVYLATATALESQWRNVSAKLINCISSFNIE